MKSKVAVGSHPMHPILVNFPIGLFGGSFVCDVIGSASGNQKLKDAGYRMMLGGLVGGLAAAVPGAVDYLTIVPPKSHAADVGRKHGLANITLVALFGANAILRRQQGSMALSLALSAAGVALMGYSGWLGGTLVYDDKIGVSSLNAEGTEHIQLPGFDAIAGEFVSVCGRDDLKKGQLALVVINGERLVLARLDDERFAAFSDSCTHMGGPLSDGALIGDRVMCPWHGSEFNVCTGAVDCGPASAPIRTYEVRIQMDRVQVKAPEVVERPLTEAGSLG